jgi:hypothetical protein
MPAGFSTPTLVVTSNTRQRSVAAKAPETNWGNAEIAAAAGSIVVVLMKSRLFIATHLASNVSRSLKVSRVHDATIAISGKAACEGGTRNRVLT